MSGLAIVMQQIQAEFINSLKFHNHIFKKNFTQPMSFNSIPKDNSPHWEQRDKTGTKICPVYKKNVLSMSDVS